MALQFIGAGFGRTATNTLKLALEELGFGRCYHMFEVIEQPAHADVWLDALDGRPVNWNALFQGYQSAVDWPVAYFWKDLWKHYPQAKIILSKRDPESWFASISSTIFSLMNSSTLRTETNRSNIAKMSRKIVLEKTFDGDINNKEHVIEIYNRHNEEVIDLVPKSQLLVFDANDGWEPLCEFVGKQPPSERLTVTNTTASFLNRLRESGMDGKTNQ